METSVKNGVRTLTLNRPNKKNAISLETYAEITKILREDSKDDNVVLTIITGKGDFFSSGNDFVSSFLNPSEDKSKFVKEMIEALINYPKILVAVINGPAIGIAATMITLCDIIYCSDKATFEIPFIRLGLSLEGCSSIQFPKILGKSKAFEMLYFNHILNADDALRLGFVADVIPHEKLNDLIKKLHTFGNLPVKTVVRNKKLATMWQKNELIQCNEEEMIGLRESFESEEFMNAISRFMNRKSKL